MGGRDRSTAADARRTYIFGPVTGALQQTLEGHTSSVSSVAFSADGRRLASSSYDTTVRVWEAKTGALQQTLEGHIDFIRSVAFSADGRCTP
jgi:WD40 repeat protein